jgi:hypothetical protein
MLHHHLWLAAGNHMLPGRSALKACESFRVLILHALIIILLLIISRVILMLLKMLLLLKMSGTCNA